MESQFHSALFQFVPTFQSPIMSGQSSELFIELSEHEQEGVAGGTTTLFNLNQTEFFSQLNLYQASGVATAGPSGASASGSITHMNQTIDTKAFNFAFGQID
ncbi:CTB family bacteriocin [Acaryochloris sp. CCMEE 5410]|uniref:CTB family bacteriocin n=1 Tax=Acaryochloris sp. CCMEE 5410 TaxID=310037 RepID=UPI0002F2A8DD|nr:CTB family bacteriocin [Acaryochloris sp. CCMEE 5410]